MPEQPGPTTSTSTSRNGSAVPVFGCVHQPAAVAVFAGPVRDVGRVLVAGGDDHLGRGQVNRRAAHAPALRIAVEAVDGGPESHVELVARGVALQVAHELV